MNKRRLAESLKTYSCRARFLLFFGAALALLGPVGVRGQNLYPIVVGPVYDIIDVIIGWKDYQGTTLTARATVKCESEHYCAIIHPPQIERTVEVEMYKLTEDQKRHLVIDCHDPCEVMIRGKIVDDEIIAIDLYDTKER